MYNRETSAAELSSTGRKSSGVSTAARFTFRRGLFYFLKTKVYNAENEQPMPEDAFTRALKKADEIEIICHRPQHRETDSPARLVRAREGHALASAGDRFKDPVVSKPAQEADDHNKGRKRRAHC
jgi:hypothetical protein